MCYNFLKWQKVGKRELSFIKGFVLKHSSLPHLKPLSYLSTEVLPRLLSVGQQFLETLAVKWKKRGGGSFASEITLKKYLI